MRTTAASCPAGKEKTGDCSPSADTQCEACEAGTTSDPGASQCTFCLAGKFVSTIGGCAECGADHLFSENKATHCDACPLGSFTSGGTPTTRTSCEPQAGEKGWYYV